MLPPQLPPQLPPRKATTNTPASTVSATGTDMHTQPSVETRQNFLDVGRFRENRVKPLLEKISKKEALTLREERVMVLADTIHQVTEKGPHLRECARFNHERLANNPVSKTLFNETLESNLPNVVVVVADCLDAASWLAQLSGGDIPVILNMANAYGPGGGYRSGAGAQEENTIRRSDWFASAKRSELATDGEGNLLLDKAGDGFRYSAKTSHLINCQEQYTCLDMEHPLVCFKGSEASGYKNLKEEEIFFYHEIRAALENLKPRFEERSIESQAEIKAEVRKRIRVLFNTLIDRGVKNVVLSAWGCGAFGHSAKVVAELFKEELQTCHKEFDRVVFAIFVDEGQTKDPRMKSYMDLSLQNVFDFHSQFHSHSAEIMHIGAGGVAMGKKIIAPDVSKAKYSVCVQFNRSRDAKFFADKLKIQPMWNPEKQGYLPLIDESRNPGKFTVRIPITIKNSNQEWVPHYEKLREEHPELTFLPKLDDIPASSPADLKAIGAQQKQEKDSLTQQMTKLICMNYFPKESSVGVSLVPEVQSNRIEYTLKMQFENKEVAAQHESLLAKHFHVERTWLPTKTITISNQAALEKFLAQCNAKVLFDEFVKFPI